MDNTKPTFEHPQEQRLMQDTFAQPVQRNTYFENTNPNVVPEHFHNGNEQPRIQLRTDIAGLFETVSSIPTGVPKDIFGQIKIYTSGASYRLYWYDTANGAWRYATGA